jgi:hypothetical protein
MAKKIDKIGPDRRAGITALFMGIFSLFSEIENFPQVDRGSLQF